MRYIFSFLLGYFLTCPAYAYIIGSTLKIQNDTDQSLTLHITQPNEGAPLLEMIPAHEVREVYMENGDYTGWLYQESVASFVLENTDSQVEYVRGRVAYYVGGAFWVKYSFLDSVVADESTQIKQIYSCKNGGNGYIFPNTLVISGAPQKGAPSREMPSTIRCDGLEKGELNEDKTKYTATCTDQSQHLVWKDNPYTQCDLGNREKTCIWTDGNKHFRISSNDPAEIMKSLNRRMRMSPLKCSELSR